MTDVIVVGGGIVGSSVTYHLARAGEDVCLIDRSDAGRATAAGAGIVSPVTSTSHDDVWFDLAAEAARNYPDLDAAVRDTGAEATGYHPCDVMVVAANRDERPTFDTARERIFDRQRRRGHPPDDELYELAPTEAAERFPPLGEVHRALYYEGGARVDGRAFAGALRTAAAIEGAEIRDGDVERLEIGNSAVRGAVVDGETVTATDVVIAGGAWSTAFAAQLDVSIPVTPQRGQIAHLDVDGETGAWPIVTAFHGHYLVPWSDGRVAAGATRESGSGFDPTTTVAGVQEVTSEALRVAPGLSDAGFSEIRVGLRPATADELPVLGPVPTVDGVHLATGHGPTGLTIGPYTGKLVAQRVRGETPDRSIEPYGLDRFA